MRNMWETIIWTSRESNYRKIARNAILNLCNKNDKNLCFGCKTTITVQFFQLKYYQTWREWYQFSQNHIAGHTFADEIKAGELDDAKITDFWWAQEMKPSSLIPDISDNIGRFHDLVTIEVYFRRPPKPMRWYFARLTFCSRWFFRHSTEAKTKPRWRVYYNRVCSLSDRSVL